ncbi:YkgJ family cysteine cluster protein [Geothrix terrae]|uniref:YkgJ family cysteine cluster protein n=1 Tax=Geothrix terrae TaxID=2922720 RepID=UPI003B849593
MHHCRAMCCRGPQCLRLTSAEVAALRNQAVHLGVAIHIIESPDGAGIVRFLDHPGEHCPMLDHSTSACRIYSSRPSPCREFPEKLRPGCAISGG